jgi:hypothetical protein
MLALYAWAVFGSTFFTVYATAVIFTVVSLLLMSIAILVLAHRRPALWRSSVVSTRIAGVPLTTVAGALALVVSIIVGYLYLRYTGLGVTNRGAAIRNIVIAIVVSIIVYFIANRVRAREGVSLTQAASEIPPD